MTQIDIAPEVFWINLAQPHQACALTSWRDADRRAIQVQEYMSNGMCAATLRGWRSMGHECAILFICFGALQQRILAIRAPNSIGSARAKFWDETNSTGLRFSGGPYSSV